MSWTLALLLTCSFLLGVGVLFTFIDIRAPFGPQYRYFARQLVVFAVMGILDQLIFLPGVDGKTELHTVQISHGVVLLCIWNVGILAHSSGTRLGVMLFKAYRAGILLSVPLFFIPDYLRIRPDGMTESSALYNATFVPFLMLSLIAYMVYLAREIIRTPRGQRGLASSHLISVLLLFVGAIISSSQLADPRMDRFLALYSMPFGFAAFGAVCAYAFSKKFFEALRERTLLFEKLGGLSRDMERLQPLGQLGESAALISHEIKNYVGVLRANNLLLRSRLRDGSGDAEVDRISRSTDRLELFTRSILDFAHGNASQAMQAIDLESVIMTVLAVNFPEKRDAIALELTPCPAILGDPTRLEQMLVNLIKNSFEAEADTVWLRLWHEQGNAVLTLRDNGHGCTPEALPRLGQPFYTTRKNQGGTGLGLAMVASILRGHGGSFTVTSGDVNGNGQPIGLAFHITLPLRRG